jgi:hypothetical protein
VKAAPLPPNPAKNKAAAPPSTASKTPSNLADSNAGSPPLLGGPAPGCGAKPASPLGAAAIEDPDSCGPK